MSLYQYNDYPTIDAPAARLTRLRLHRQEVKALILPASNGPDASLENKHLVAYEAQLKTEEDELQDYVLRMTTPIFQRIRRRAN